MDQPTRLSRRHALRLLAAGSAAALVPTLAMRPRQVGATRVWCRADPLFQVGNKLVDVTIGTYDDMFLAATGPVQITLTTPPNVPVKLWWADNGFGYGYAISYAVDASLKGDINNPQVHVQVMCPATDALPVSVYYSTLTSVTQQRLEFVSTEHVGIANQLVTVFEIQAVAPAVAPVATKAATSTPTSSSKRRKSDD